ncbi:FUSC family protein [Stenotrophomonas sp. 24(2023)]|uniref:FUSC family protein n=1 Tax=Stenotrophomonas sp. 24(2023) TaxID=3068324 RepID=UPI0027E1093E|nr:FUSC family protein [Stenotrophomonas sp. 24(2023)]WMJ69421.1 FUSC family protein [Stenotrophomonas sp. 24(2023)]
MHIPHPIALRRWRIRRSLDRPLALLTSPALRADQEAALFSLKCLLAAVLGLYVSLRIGLTRPFWVVGTVYLVSQPLSGATLSRGLFRLLGTAGGAAATVLLVPRFANAPLVLSAALAAWMALCLYLAMLDRTPRAYAFLLAGYTTSLIGFPSVMAPGEVFSIALVRVQEIAIGILAATLVHALLLPRRVGPRVRQRAAAVLADAERWTADMQTGAAGTALAQDRAKLAMDLLELHTLSIHLPFDSAHGITQVQILRALHDRLLDVLVLSSAVDDAQAQLRATAHGPADAGSWTDLLQASLSRQWVELEAAQHDCRLLERQLHSAAPDWRRRVPPHLAGAANGHQLHRDHRLALRSALGAFVGILLSCALWIGSAWPDGATAVSIIGTACVLFGTSDAPAGNVLRYLAGSAIGVAVGLVYGLAVFPAVSGFPTLIAVLAPALLLGGCFLARPPYIMAALGVLLTFPLVAGLGATNAWSFIGAINSGVALFAGTGAALCSMLLFQTLDANYSRRRLQDVLAAGMARHAAGRSGDATVWTSRMVDRLGLLAPRLRGHADAAGLLRRAFAGMRAAMAIAELRALGNAAISPSARAALAPLNACLATPPRSPFATPVPPDARVLQRLEQARTALLAGDAPERAELLLALSNLRRDLLSPLTPSGGQRDGA